MRLTYTSLAAVAVLAMSGTAAVAASTTTHSVTATMSGTSRLSSGGKLKMTTTRKPAGRRIGVQISYDVTVRSKTVLAFAVYPCKSTSCNGQSESVITLGTGGRHVKFHGSVPVVVRANGEACVFAQLRDRGPGGKSGGRIVRRGSRKGVTLCSKR